MSPASPHDAGHYEFGQNWRSFVEHHLTPERIDEAMRSLVEFLGKSSLAGSSFVDIGCGSGLFSLAAHRLGAAPIVSLDVDPDSVGCCRELAAREGSQEGWRVLQGSVLDRDLVASLGSFDVVYSWGVLHHTGAMWDAIANAAGLVRPGGLFYIAIYNKADAIGVHSDGRVGTSRFWEIEKRIYKDLPGWGRKVVDYSAAAAMMAVYALTGRNPVREVKNHKSLRGMSWMVDIRDWLGGWPYEYASVEEIFTFVRDRFGFELVNLRSTTSLRNNEFLFRRPPA